MELHSIHNKSEILKFLMSNPELQVYSIGDLDEFFWPKTIWYSLKENDEIKALALLYIGMSTPTLLAIYDKDFSAFRELIERLKPILPTKFYAHLSPGLVDIFGKNNIIQNFGNNIKMALRPPPLQINDNNIRKLVVDDIQLIEEFYKKSYPDNWFDKRMIETEKYLGYFINNMLVGIAGIHVYSKEYKVAALGNIATHPDYRGKGIGFKLTSALCSDLKKTVDHIGLNVKSNNDTAISCYKKIGFEIIGNYDECLIKNG
ncbi:MAG: GNAT family N-acetyltransferase [Bacteroidales bacterium]|nr:GNAT family N-acetyltransferase [Bacteroidales bacterium]